MEIWKEIEGFSNYMISSEGRVKSAFGTIRKFTTTKKGYLKIGLIGDDKVRKKLSVHRLVAQAFILNTDSKPQVNHIDCNKSNNNVSNLEWCTNSENQKHAFKHGLQNNKGVNNPRAIFTMDDIRDIRRLREIGLTYLNIANMYNVGKTTIYKIINKETWNYEY